MESVKRIFTVWIALESWKKIFLAMVSGILFGLLAGDYALYLKPVGILFINAIKMMIVPVIFTAIVCAILSIRTPQAMRRIGIKTLLLYAFSMAVAAVIGLTVATMIAPGAGLSLPLGTEIVKVGKMPALSELVIAVIPANPLESLVQTNILQILVFAVFIGISINLAGQPGEPIRHLFRALWAVVFQLTSLVMRFAPYGIFALLAATAGEYGMKALLPLFKLVLAGYLSCILVCIFFYAPILKWVAGLSPLTFFRGISDAVIVAFSCSSSTATLPVSIRCSEKNLGVSESIAGFLLPLGTTLNLNGLAIYLSITAVFASNIYGIPLGMGQYLTLLVTIVLTSMGAGGIPGSALIVMGAVMSSIGLPLGAIPLIAGIDRIIDMGMTATNVTGDIFAAVLMAKSEDELDPAFWP